MDAIQYCMVVTVDVDLVLTDYIKIAMKEVDAKEYSTLRNITLKKGTVQRYCIHVVSDNFQNSTLW